MISEPEPARRELAAAAARWGRPDRWAPVPAELDHAIASDLRLAEAARSARKNLLRDALRRLGSGVPSDAVERYADAVLRAPRERFVLPEDIASSAEDAPSPLDRAGLATVSAPHAYLLSYGLIGLGEGCHLLELGSGTGYGASLASFIVGSRGRITSIEIDPALHERALRLLAEPDAHGPAPTQLFCGDARTLAPDLLASAVAWTAPIRVVVTYALTDAPEALLARLPEGGRLIAPVGAAADAQLLELWTRSGGVLHRTTHGAVRYVPER